MVWDAGNRGAWWASLPFLQDGGGVLARGLRGCWGRGWPGVDVGVRWSFLHVLRVPPPFHRRPFPTLRDLN